MGNIGPWELILILVVALIVVGPGKLPDVAKSLGKATREFKKATSGIKKEFDEVVKTATDEPKPIARTEAAPATDSAQTAEAKQVQDKGQGTSDPEGESS